MTNVSGLPVSQHAQNQGPPKCKRVHQQVPEQPINQTYTYRKALQAFSAENSNNTALVSRQQDAEHNTEAP